jgi:hypothetical protein
MRKKMKPLGKVNEAIRKAESQALFKSMLKEGKAKVITPNKYKGTRQEKLREALDNE